VFEGNVRARQQFGTAVLSLIALLGPVVAVWNFLNNDSPSTVFILIATLFPLVVTAMTVAYLLRYSRHESAETLVFGGGIGAALLATLFAVTAQSIIWGQRTYGITMADPLALTTEMGMGGALFGLIYGHFYGVSVVQQRRMERQRRQVQRRNERLNEFADVVSHDLRNPLNVAQGRVELIAEECDSTGLDSVARALDRMEAIIEDVLELSRTGELADEVEALELSAVAEACWANVDTGSAELTVSTDRSILADETRVCRLLENLFRNAVEHGGETVTVSVGDLPSGFYVADNGSGLPADGLERVFEAGFSTERDGTGLGLSIARQVAHAHGWEIGATESRNGGARFEITEVDIVS